MSESKRRFAAVTLQTKVLCLSVLGIGIQCSYSGIHSGDAALR